MTISNSYDVSVFSSNRLTRYKGDEDTRRWGISCDIEEALKNQYTTEAACAAYTFAESDTPYMIATVSLPYIPEEERILLSVLFIDLDTKPKKDWETLEVPLLMLNELTTKLKCAGYLTLAGIRLVLKLKKPVAREAWSSVYMRFIDYYRDAIEEILEKYNPANMLIDTSGSEWDRLFILPHVVRDRGSTHEIANLVIPKDWQPTSIPTSVEIVKKIEEEQPSGPTFTDVQKKTVLTKLAGVMISPEDRKLLNHLKSNTAFFDSGERNSAIFKAAALLFRRVEELTTYPPRASYIYSLLYGSVYAGDTGTDTHESLKETWSICARLYDERYLEYEKRQTTLAVKEERTLRGDYQPLLIFFGRDVYFVHNGETYLPPVYNSNTLLGIAENNWKSMGITVRNAKGSFLSIAELTAAHGAQADEVRYRMGNPLTHYDQRYRTLDLPAAKLADVKPEFNKEIDTWLRLFCGEQEADREAFLDWLATFHVFSKPTCLLYFRAAPGIGKGMLASGICSMFNGAAAVSFREAISQFNNALIQVPFIWEDEKLRVTEKVDISALVRDLTTRFNHRIGKKYGDSISLRGYLRFMITANNYHALPMEASSEQYDKEAVISRVRFMNCGAAAADYLKSLGGDSYTREQQYWVETPEGEPGKIAQHIAFLRNTRDVKYGSRFIVEGVETEWHRRMIYSPNKATAVLAIAKALNTAKGKEYCVYNKTKGIIAVFVPELHDQMERLVKNTTMSLAVLKHTVSELATSEKSVQYRFEGVQRRAVIIDAVNFYEQALTCDSEYADYLKELLIRDGFLKPDPEETSNE